MRSERRTARDKLARAVAIGGTLLFVALTVREIGQRGSWDLRAPATVISNSLPPQKESESYLLFLADIRRVLPEGTSVAVFGPHRDTEGPLGIDYLLATSQLPGHRVEPWPAVPGDASLAPRYLAIYREGLPQARYRLVGKFSSGQVYELRR